MQILIQDLKFRTIIGVLKEERSTPQEVVINLVIEYDYKNGKVINYADICTFVENFFLDKRFLYLEEAFEETTKALRAFFPKINAIEMEIFKPNIVKNARVGIRKKTTYM